MWIVRFILLGLFVAQVTAGGFFMIRRQRYAGLFESRAVNLGIVIAYCLICVLLAGLPSDPNVLTPPAFLAEPAVRTGYSVVGLILIGTAVLIWIVAVNQRKALGGQDVKAGLLTSGLYRRFRHPI
jgi:protein-S-isoprenylcysteine O-methyltransferase Ste14